MFNNIPPAGFPQIDLSQDVKRINAELSGMASNCSSILTDITAETVTVSDNPLSITDALSADAISVVAEIEPEQDMHGYDRPWSGGSGKNKLPLVLADIKSANTSGTWSGNVYTIDTMSITVETDNYDNVVSISLNGSTPNTITFKLCSKSAFLSDGNYILTDGITDASPYLNITVYKNNVWLGTTTNGAFNLSNVVSTDLFYAEIFVNPNVGELTNKSFYPMIRLASVTDATFEPYSNICPISGMSSVNVTTTDGTDTNTATASLGTTVYGGSVDVTEGSASVTMANIASYDGETIGEPWLSSMDEYVSGATPTTGAQVVYTLATPTTLSFTSDDLTMLDGENTISTDAEEVSVEYIKNTLVGRVRRLEEEQ